jgi:hypothetical protein
MHTAFHIPPHSARGKIMFSPPTHLSAGVSSFPLFFHLDKLKRLANVFKSKIKERGALAAFLTKKHKCSLSLLK